MTVTQDAIARLLEQYLAICDSSENRRNAAYWTNAGEPWLIERWRGISARRKHAPFTMAMDIAGYSTILDIDCPAYYSDPDVQLHEQLRYHLWEARHLKCHRFFDKTAFVSFGAAFFASLFGATVVFPAGQAPWVDLQHPVIVERGDLGKLPSPSLRTGGLAPRVHQFYERMKELTEGSGIEVMYPVPIRAPFSIATQLRETTQLLVDMMESPPFVHDLMRRITDGLMSYVVERAEYLGSDMAPAVMFNDEVGTPMVSGAMYEEFILPYELELAEHHRGVTYWHSCAVTDEMHERVRTIPNLRMVHVGPWSDVALAAQVFSETDIALDICVNATEDVYDRTPEEMEQKLAGIRDACEGQVRYAVRADGFQILRSMDEDLASIRKWGEAAARVFG